MEFLGDSILSCVIANALYEQFPHRSEGELSRLRAFLVKGDRLAEIATEINLGDHLLLGPGELKSGGFRRASILTDALEAILAAVFLDGGFLACQTVILKLYQTRLQNPELDHHLKDAKTQLQEYLQAHKHPLPEYTLSHVEGEEHHQQFHVTCTVTALSLSTKAHAETRRRAEQDAAKQILNRLKLS